MITWLEEHDRDGRTKRFPLLRWAVAVLIGGVGGFVGAALDQRRQRR